MLDIIITTYNNPQDLDKALSSIVAQTCDSFKVTIVDDASIEDYHKVIEEYSQKIELSYIKNKKNIGPGLSRQKGIENSNAEYFLFLDSDDRLLPYAVQLIEEMIKRNNFPDILIFPFYNQVLEHEKINNNSILFGKDVRKLITWHHGKVYKRKAIEKYDIKIPEEFSYTCDDFYYNVYCFSLLNNQVMCDMAYYLWVQNPESVTHTRNTTSSEIAKKTVDALMDILEKVSKYKEANTSYIIAHLQDGINDTIRKRIDDENVIDKIKEVLNKNKKSRKNP